MHRTDPDRPVVADHTDLLEEGTGQEGEHHTDRQAEEHRTAGPVEAGHIGHLAGVRRTGPEAAGRNLAEEHHRTGQEVHRNRPQEAGWSSHP